MPNPTPSPDRVADLTPPTRNRTVDLLRALSLVVVVLGHWLLAVVSHDGNGFEGANLLALQPATTWLTWVFQIMPVFFLVGGFANGGSWERARRSATPYGRWVGARSARMLRPAVAFLLFAVGAVVVARMLGTPEEAVDMAGGLVTVPLWFLAAYLPVVAATPLLIALHRRFGAAVPLSMIGGAAIVDIAHRGFGLPGVGWLNFALVWPLAHQLGFAWRDGTLPRSRATAIALLAGGATGLVVLTQVLGYPVAMVGGPGAGPTSNAPPSLAIVALTLAQLGLILGVEARLERWLTRPRVWTAVVVVNLHAMTLFCWHLAVLVAVAATALPLRLFPQPEAGSLTWWAWRPAWFLLLAGVLGAVVVAARRFEHRPAPPSAATGSAARCVVGVTGVSVGLSLLALHGLVGGAGPAGLPLLPLTLFTGGIALLGLLPQARRAAAAAGTG